jgi:cell division protein FtsW (lipid II flippase)
MNNLIPEEVYKRKHYGTPQSALLIISNFAVLAVTMSIFAGEKHINSFFWVAMGLLALYNFFNIRKDREEYNRVRIIAYVVSVLLMIALFTVTRLKV